MLKSLVTRYKCPLANLLMSLKKADKAKNSFFKNIGVLSNMFEDGRIRRANNVVGIPAEEDICIRAAQLLQTEARVSRGSPCVPGASTTTMTAAR